MFLQNIHRFIQEIGCNFQVYNVKLSPALGLALASAILFHALWRSRYEWLYLQGYWTEARLFRSCCFLFELIVMLFVATHLSEVLIFLDAIEGCFPR